MGRGLKTKGRCEGLKENCRMKRGREIKQEVTGGQCLVLAERGEKNGGNVGKREDKEDGLGGINNHSL